VGNQYCKGKARALISSIIDVFNHFFLDLQINFIKTSESEIAKLNIKSAKGIIEDIPAIIVFDRGYPSIEFVDFLEKNNIKYLFRLSSNNYKQERENMSKMDGPVKIIHVNFILVKIKKSVQKL
jgi:hypothetical protein